MKEINPKIKIVISLAVIVVLIFGFYIITEKISKLTGKAVASGNLDEFAKCLTQKGVKMYGAFWCGHCQNTKASFGSSWNYVTYIECDPRGPSNQAGVCIDKGIEGYPTWEINNKLLPGEKSLEQIAELSGCKI